ncbi:rRNA biogenesis protein rrp36 [Penicillium sp. IBT 18751x]|nr:rRNA biogenesis protein rrp36 [Penicillium sp. IBT 18751x]
MAISDILNRRVRARPADDDDDYLEQSDAAEEVSQDDGEGEEDSDAESQSEESSEKSNVSEDDGSDGSDSAAEDEEESSEDEDNDIKASLSNISFGALAKAQASMGPKKRKEKASKEEASPVDDIRARILEAREQKRLAAEKSESKDKKDKKAARANKHAPMEQSSKRAVSRRLVVVEPPSHAKARDPRFDAAVMGHSGKGKNPELADKAYAFLDDYRLSELKEMKAEMARTKNPEQKEALKRQILSASDRMKTMENRKRERKVQLEHKQKEKQMLREGKKSTPYFLKKSDLKKQVMQKKYEEMGSRDRARALERRRKKIASKERKEMPWERRGAEDSGSGFGGGGGPPKRRRLD